MREAPLTTCTSAPARRAMNCAAAEDDFVGAADQVVAADRVPRLGPGAARKRRAGVDAGRPRRGRAPLGETSPAKFGWNTVGSMEIDLSVRQRHHFERLVHRAAREPARQFADRLPGLGDGRRPRRRVPSRWRSRWRRPR